MRAVIVANGRLSDLPADRARLRTGDWIVAADGGLHNCRRLGQTPSVVIGDFDSLHDEDLTALELAQIRLVRHPARKDETDLELALRFAVENGAGEILVLGALGDRWDQSVANTLLLALSEVPAPETVLVDGRQEVRLLRGGQTLSLSGRIGDTVSLIPIRGDARGVTTEGLEYPLADETLVFSATRGVSNTMRVPKARVSLAEGALLVVLIHERPSTSEED